MKNTRSITLLLTLLSMIASQQLSGKFSFENIRSWFKGKAHEQVIDKEFNAAEINTLVLENIDGDIFIKNSWKENKILLTATKHVKNEKNAQHIRISKQDREGTLTLKTVYQEKVKGIINYELIVPVGMKLQLSTKNGSIYLKDTQGPIVAATEQGNIHAQNVQKTIKATTKNSGSIAIANVQGDVYAMTNYGSINVSNATKNIIAEATTRGAITVSCTELPPTSTIQLQTKSGIISVALPAAANATIEGSTRRGSVTSDHYLTLKSHTTKLNRQAWMRFKREVHGILGTGEADIKLSANSGNIKILQAKTT